MILVCSNLIGHHLLIQILLYLYCIVLLILILLFVFLDLEIDQWRAINSTIGVRAIISHGDRPTPVPDQLIKEIKEREDSKGLVDVVNASSLNPNEKVRVTGGPLIDRIGLFQCLDDNQRVLILMELMGQYVEVRLSKSEIVRAES